MVFNWFRRKSSNSSATPQEAEPTPTAVDSDAETGGEITSSEEPSQDVVAARLDWAKAAYKNIQQQQSQQVAEVEGETEPVQAAGDLLSRGALEQEGLAPTEQVETGTDEQDTVTTAEVSNELVSTEISEQPASAPLSFLAKAEAERQARLERLKATAIEVPLEVAPKAVIGETGTTQQTQTEPGLTFDEGFLWSAEILANQGRRPEDVSIEEITWLKKLRQGLDKTRRNIVNQLKAIVGQGPLNQAAVMEIEALLLQADVGVEATEFIIEGLQNRLKEEALPPDAAIAYLKQILRDMLDQPLQTHNPIFAPEKEKLNIWLITGVNGAGKTTTIGKIAHIAQKSGYKCLIGAADTFRAAAVEQVKVWGARSGIEVIANPGQNTDPAAVVFDAIAAAQSRGTELLLVDTAGRLQNKKNLMDELGKIRRIVDKKASNAKIESLLVLDATLGQNGLRQAEVFAQAAHLTGVVLTKLDGSAKGGIALAVVKQLGLPIRFIGAGEGIEDLRPFSSYEFVEALLSS
ncbi:MAG: signal recognition particle-docking protein FtsY [Gloeocapsa sp. UFS-A4-WI-NPMV-4B04]|jgi:fused signal recognition particle receptor|nr:signal recognition particle-docking protein FtsY [Gloeocapsa sp. UFS-A4-WI-NPMV-4B04]